MISIGMFHEVRRVRILVLLGASLALAGCASIATIAPTLKADEEYLKAHYVLPHEDGFALSITETDRLGRHTKLSATEAREDIKKRIIAGLDAHVLRLWPSLGETEEGEEAKGTPLQLMLYAHGGLNGYRGDFNRMKALLATPADCSPAQTSGLFVSAGCGHARSLYYPVFINWNSAGLDSVVDDLFEIRFGQRLKDGLLALGILTAPFVTAGRLTEAIFNAPNAFWANWKTFGQSEPDVWDGVEEVVTMIPRILTTPVVKAFGTSAWDIMNRRAGVLTAPHLAEDREGTVWSLLTELDSRIVSKDGRVWWQVPSRRGARVPIEITLVGHSMGAIVVNRFLAASQGRSTALAIKRVVYLAAAASIKASEAVKLINEDNKHVHFWSFVLNREDEARERSFVGLAPRGTLLVWVDDFFEPIVEPADKRDGEARSQKDFWGFWPTGQGICEWSGPGRPRTHGAVNEPDYLEAELRKVDPNVFVPNAPQTKRKVHCAGEPQSENN